MAVSGHSVTHVMQPTQLIAVKLGDLRRNIGEIAQHAGAGRHERTCHADVGRQVVVRTRVVGADHAFVEVFDVAFQVDLEDRAVDADGMRLHARAGFLDQRSQPLGFR